MPSTDQKSFIHRLSGLQNYCGFVTNMKSRKYYLENKIIFMPKTKDIESKKIKRPVIEEEEKEIDPEVILDDDTEDMTDDESPTLDTDEIDPFGDKWEE